MATKLQILDAIRTTGEPLTLTELAHKLGCESQDIKRQVEKWTGKNLINKNQNKQYSLSKTGEAELVELRVEAGLSSGGTSSSTSGTGQTDQTSGPSTGGPEGGPGTGEKPPAFEKKDTPPGSPLTEEGQGLTPYQYFYNIGKQLGIEDNLCSLVTKHVWLLGKYDDLDWVWKALTEMQIRPDLCHRWFQGWRAYLHLGIPPSLKPVLEASSTGVSESGKDKGAAGAEKTAIGHRTHIIRDNIPVYVGPDLGDLSEQDAVDLCKLRTARGAGTSAGEVGGTAPKSEIQTLKDLPDVIAAIKKLGGDDGKGKSYIVTEGKDGNAVVQEIEPGKPFLLPNRGGGGNPPVTYYVDEDGNTQEIPLGKPLVIMKKAAPGSETPTVKKRYLVDKATGNVTEIDGDAPIVIQTAPPAGNPPAGGTTMIPFVTPDGKPFQLDISTYFRLEEHKQKMEHDEETHNVKMEIGKGARDLISRAAKAFANMED